MDEPFSVDGLCHILKNLDASGVVLDEVVVGTEDGGNFALGREWGKWNFNIKKSCFRNL